MVLTTGSRSDGSRLELTLNWLGDRYGQLLTVVGPSGGRRVVLESCEGSADEPCPPSPPLQQILLHTTVTQSPAALGVGMAGTSHWSVSIEADPQVPRIVWDVACRCQAPAAGRLTSTFRTAETHSAETHPADPETASNPQPVPLDVPDGGPAEVRADGRQTEFRPAAAAVERGAAAGGWATVRWRFAWELPESSGP